jgi:CheY-like chemotaxis protein
MELTRILKSKYIESGKDAVIMISATEWSDIEDEAKKAGVDRFISKPMFPSAIIGAINSCLNINKQDALDDIFEEIVVFEGKHILLAEDIDVNREIAITMLEPTLISIDCAENGRQAVEMFKKSPGKYSLILMDLQMPEMDGYEATRNIRTAGLPESDTIPIIAMTANVFREDIEKCINAGMNGHIGKPVNFDELIDKLKQFL